MSCDLQIVKTSDFVKLDAEGKFDFEGSFRVLSNVAKACVDRGIHCALLDVRDAERSLSLTELYRLAHAFHEMGFRKEDHLAVLHRFDVADRAEMFAMFASDRGWNVRAFDQYEEAIEWFMTVTSAKQPPTSQKSPQA